MKARYTIPMTVAGGLLAGGAIRSALHGGGWWPLLAALALGAWASAGLSLWLPYGAGR